MTTIRTLALLSICCVLLGACATVPEGPSVVAMPGSGKAFDAFQGDDLVCRQWAAQQAGTSPERAGALAIAKDAGIGTLLGAGLGAALGAIAHNPGLGAAVGAGGGVLAGTAFGAGAGQRAANEVQHRDLEIAEILSAAHARVTETLTGRRAALEALAKLLMDKEVVGAESLRALLV